jgi:hypothetical protein
MDRTLTTKSIRFREFSQWTAATTLVAAGTLALFSATTLKKLSINGEVAIDLHAFRKLESTSLAFDRIDDQRLIAEEARLLDRAAAAAATPLPKTRTAFAKIRLHPKKAQFSRKIIAKTKKDFPSGAEILAGTPIVLSSADAKEIAQLEKVPDPAVESRALAQVYRNLRFQFLAAADRLDTDEYPAESIAIAKANAPTVYEEIPEYHEGDFANAENVAAIRVTEPAPTVETAPANAEGKFAEVTISDSELKPESKAGKRSDEIQISTSSAIKKAALTTEENALEAMTADPTVMNVAKDKAGPEHSHLPKLAEIYSPGLDVVPEMETEKPNTHGRISMGIQNISGKQATGPPEKSKSLKPAPSLSLQAKSAPALDAIPAKRAMAATPESPEDLREYSNDIASAYQKLSKDAADDDQLADYSHGVAEDSIIDGDFSARPSESRRAKKVQVQDYGYGVHRDPKGITIDWSEKGPNRNPRTTTNTVAGGKIYVGRPSSTRVPTRRPITVSAAERHKSLRKFSFIPPTRPSIQTSQSSALVHEPAVDVKKCETALIGMEAFNAGAEKETFSICRRELSLEGAAQGSQPRWWESFENESEHWPTLSYLRPGEATSTNRIPLLSTASIRILSAISKTNTHTGTGIIFGEVAKGLEIKLLGRSDSPIYLDGGMKLRDPSAEVTGSRPFVILNVEPGQPLLEVKNSARKISGAIPLVVKSGMATHVKIHDPKERDLSFSVFDASSTKEKRMANLTVEVVGQPGKMGITDGSGTLKIKRVVVFDEFPIYVDLLKNEKSYKNRFRIRPQTLAGGPFALYFFDEKQVGGWLSQLAGGLSPYSGLLVGISPAAVSERAKGPRFFKIGILEKKSSLVPERYLLDNQDRLISDSELRPDRNRYVGVQIPEGPVIPTIIDGKGEALWSELVYAQPGVINVLNPDL